MAASAPALQRLRAPLPPPPSSTHVHFGFPSHRTCHFDLGMPAQVVGRKLDLQDAPTLTLR
jgi:hypothetical protein